MNVSELTNTSLNTDNIEEENVLRPRLGGGLRRSVRVISNLADATDASIVELSQRILMNRLDNVENHREHLRVQPDDTCQSAPEA